MYNQALRKSSRAVRYFPSLRAVVNQMVRNLQQGAVLSTSSTDTGLHGGGTGTCISLIYYLANKKTNSFFQYYFAGAWCFGSMLFKWSLVSHINMAEKHNDCSFFYQKYVLAQTKRGFIWMVIHKVFTFSQLTYFTCVQNNSSQGFQ